MGGEGDGGTCSLFESKREPEKPAFFATPVRGISEKRKREAFQGLLNVSLCLLGDGEDGGV